MIIDIKIPSPGESVTEVAIGNWLVENMDYVEKDQEIAEVETDKATLPLMSPEAGMIKILVHPGQKIQVGDVACTIDTSAKPKPKTKKNETGTKTVSENKVEAKTESPGKRVQTEQVSIHPPNKPQPNDANIKTTPVARKMIEENNLDLNDIINGLRKLTKRDVELVIGHLSQSGKEQPSGVKEDRKKEIIPMSPLRRKLSKRLVAVKNETAMLTTFNEVDMSSLLEMRKKYQQNFQEKYGIKLGLVSFFVKASAEALRYLPRINSMIEGDDIIIPNYVDISIAVQTEKGLMAPVIRNVNRLNIVEIEKSISDLAQKARTSMLSIEEMTGGTFTITNGGVFGSMLSTPIINPPQSAILGMHNIVERPVVVHGKIDARPVMYIALSYDHRLIDGKDSVNFLVKVKEYIENPVMMTGVDHERSLLGLL